MNNLTDQQQEIIKMITSEFKKLNDSESKDAPDIHNYINAARQKIFADKENRRILNDANTEMGNKFIYQLCNELLVLSKYRFWFETNLRWGANSKSPQLKIDVHLPYTLAAPDSDIGKEGESKWTVEQIFQSRNVPGSTESYAEFIGVVVRSSGICSATASANKDGIDYVTKFLADKYLSQVHNFPHRYKTL